MHTIRRDRWPLSHFGRYRPTAARGRQAAYVGHGHFCHTLPSRTRKPPISAGLRKFVLVVLPYAVREILYFEFHYALMMPFIIYRVCSRFREYCHAVTRRLAAWLRLYRLPRQWIMMTHCCHIQLLPSFTIRLVMLLHIIMPHYSWFRWIITLRWLLFAAYRVSAAGAYLLPQRLSRCAPTIVYDISLDNEHYSSIVPQCHFSSALLRHDIFHFPCAKYAINEASLPCSRIYHLMKLRREKTLPWATASHALLSFRYWYWWDDASPPSYRRCLTMVFGDEPKARTSLFHHHGQ